MFFFRNDRLLHRIVIITNRWSITARRHDERWLLFCAFFANGKYSTSTAVLRLRNPHRSRTPRSTRPTTNTDPSNSALFLVAFPSVLNVVVGDHRAHIRCRLSTFILYCSHFLRLTTARDRLIFSGDPNTRPCWRLYSRLRHNIILTRGHY